MSNATVAETYTFEQAPTIQLQEEILWDPEYRRNYNDVTTWAAEMLDGRMRTPFEFTFDGQELYGEDGMPLGKVFKDALVDARRKATENPDLAFLVRMAREDMGEYKDMLAMARGELPNTMVVESDFPFELVDATEDVEGINVTRRQTMQRVIALLPNGNISMVSDSLESSDRDGLEAIYDYLGKPAEEGPLLGQRRYLDLEPEEQEFLGDHLTGVYDRTLEKKFGGNYSAGWRKPTKRADVNTYDFVLAQPDLVHTFLCKGGLNSQSLFGFAAAMRQRYESSIDPQVTYEHFVSSPSHSDPMLEMYQAAAHAIVTGQVFSGCGISIGMDGKLTTLEQLQQLGFGNNREDEDDGDCVFESEKCPLCPATKVKTTITKTHIYGDCGCSVKRT